MKKKRTKNVKNAAPSVSAPGTYTQATRWVMACETDPCIHPRAEVIEMTKVALAALIAKHPAYMQNPDDEASIAYSDRYRKSCAKAAVSYAIHALNAISEQGNVK